MISQLSLYIYGSDSVVVKGMFFDAGCVYFYLFVIMWKPVDVCSYLLIIVVDH